MCEDGFEEFPNTLSFNGEAQGTVDDLDACEAICLADDECEAFDYNIVTRKCFTHTAGYQDRVGATAPANINQYRRLVCGSSVGTNAVADTSIVTGTLAPGVSSTSGNPGNHI